MKSPLRAAAERHPVATYAVLTYAFSWSVFIPFALKKHGIIQFPLSFSWYYCAAYGPLLGAIITTALVEGAAGLRDLFGRMVRWRVGPIWWVVAVSPIILYAIMAGVLFVLHGEWMDPTLLGQVEFLPDLGLWGLALWLLTYGLGEETGWRGFALPRLQRSRSALRATVILWMIWAGWHAPAFFLVYDPAIIPGFLPGLLAGAIVFTWLYNSTGGSILMLIIWHGVFNFVTGSKASKAGITSAIISTIVMAWAVILVFVFKSENLSHRAKQIH